MARWLRFILAREVDGSADRVQRRPQGLGPVGILRCKQVHRGCDRADLPVEGFYQVADLIEIYLIFNELEADGVLQSARTGDSNAIARGEAVEGCGIKGPYPAGSDEFVHRGDQGGSTHAEGGAIG